MSDNEDDQQQQIEDDEQQQQQPQQQQEYIDQEQDSKVPNAYANTLVHGTNPQNLIEKITRNKIYNCSYWKEHCFGLTAETIIEKAIKLECIGGTFGGIRKPTKFLCLILKMLQIQIEKEIIVEYIHNEHYKYLSVLGAMYLRLTGTPKDIYENLEPLYADYRKLRFLRIDGTYEITHVDEFVQKLLTGSDCCDISLPFMPKRHLLEKVKLLYPRMTMLSDEDIEKFKQLDKSKEDNGSSGESDVMQQEEQQDGSTNNFGLKFKKQQQVSKRPRDGDDDDDNGDDNNNNSSNNNAPGGGGNDQAMSIEETNKLRAQLGLKPLRE